MIRQLPLMATAITLAAVATMVALGFWQLGRAQEKEGLLARYAAVSANSPQVAWPRDDVQAQELLFRQSTVDCHKVQSIDSRAGTSANGAKGWGHYANCTLADGKTTVLVALGWSREIITPQWDGGTVAGVIAPGPRLVASEPVAGLEPLSPPDPADIPNNHLAYAGQWFFFAFTALIIFVLAIRKRNKEQV